MSMKNLDRHNRWRNKTVAFRVSPQEDEQLEIFVKLSGLTKQDYITRRLLEKEVVVQGNPRVYKALRDELAAVLDELRRIEAGQGVNDELLDTIQMIATIMSGMQEEAAYGIDAKEKTALGASVGADAGQSIQKESDTVYPFQRQNATGKRKILRKVWRKWYRKMQRMADPRYLHTLTMTERCFRPPTKAARPLLKICSIQGRTFLQVRPRSASRFWWRRSPTMSAPGRICGAAKPTRELSSTLRWRMTSSAFRTGCL